MTAKQRERSQIYKRVSQDLFKDFEEFQLIDNMVKQYPQYTHDDVFEFELIFLQNLLVLSKLNDYVMSKMQELDNPKK